MGSILSCQFEQTLKFRNLLWKFNELKTIFIIIPEYLDQHSLAQRRHLGGLGAIAPPHPQGKRKREKREKKEKKKKGNYYEWRQITTYKVLFFPIFQ